MSYNTRRGGGYPQQQQQQIARKSVGNIGQRRPVATNNFTHGGTLTSLEKPIVAAPTAGRLQQNQQSSNMGTLFRTQAQQQQSTQQQFNTAKQQTQQKLEPPQVQQQQPQVQQQQQPQVQQQQQPQVQQQQPQVQQQQQSQHPFVKKEEVQENQLKNQQEPEQTEFQTANEVTDNSMEVEGPKKKPFWVKAGAGSDGVLSGKIPRRERTRRRNIKLSKILQPKNAVMILNELVKNIAYVFEEPSAQTDGQFKATVTFDGVEHTGYGRTKIMAKNLAAEAALKHYVKANKLTTEVKKDDENEKMEVSEDPEVPQTTLPWQHVASFALYKLFCAWGEDPHLVKNQPQNANTNANVNPERPHENRPAKKMPDNPETINPMMLINQMLPHAQFEEIEKTGTPPDIVFSFRCNVDGQSFVGSGPNKKSAKRMAAFAACHKILSISYPPDVYVPNY